MLFNFLKTCHLEIKIQVQIDERGKHIYSLYKRL